MLYFYKAVKIITTYCKVCKQKILEPEYVKAGFCPDCDQKFEIEEQELEDLLEELQAVKTVEDFLKL